MRYFLSVAYQGTHYAGFQIQDGQETIQSQLTKALEILFRESFTLTGSSRTDAGVHAEQNYFHFDTAVELKSGHRYNLNAILPSDIAVTGIYGVSETAHCRFDATERVYKYLIYKQKNPFLTDKGWLYPYPLNLDILQRLSVVLRDYEDFSSFSKRNTQVFTYNCAIGSAYWQEREKEELEFHIRSNRFLRGMIRGIVGTMLRIARTAQTLEEAELMFRGVIEAKDCAKADFTTPARGLYLMEVNYPEGLLKEVD
ncbi:tRNA pseudouridine(38-40) synthase TruA [Sediminibacterium sp.]|uniref:tRNA pseudouridine(38-40) synthase TruA n=1 Tax=Sediminibacterium sp. TaxID=1917865 RepID=UPI0025E68125|nr:tRNA pseudouridine(38-40) synthase TruA [Sediminibacterium sp.]MBW0178557.1 tRNA pseudouridine(38-40) synthase TruA [Sediminibacterium sp.]